jgi:hypothetical protein
MTVLMRFDTWKRELREDCARNNEMCLFDKLGDYVLELLWRSEAAPTVRGILGHASPEPSDFPKA